MFTASTVIMVMLLWDNAAARVPLVEGDCNQKFISVYPPDIMFNGNVIKHTDDYQPSKPDCMNMKLGRRSSFNAMMRVDLFTTVMDPETELKNDIAQLAAEVIVEAEKPLLLTIGGMEATPPHLMITRFDKEEGCYAAWSCADMKGKIQKSAWIVCKDTNVDTTYIDELVQDICEKAEIDKAYFVDTNKDDC